MVVASTVVGVVAKVVAPMVMDEDLATESCPACSRTTATDIALTAITPLPPIIAANRMMLLLGASILTPPLPGGCPGSARGCDDRHASGESQCRSPDWKWP